MATSRTIYQYHFKLGNKIVHTGITKDPDRREAEHRRHEGWERGHIKQVGSRTTAGGGAEVGGGTAKSGQANRSVALPGCSPVAELRFHLHQHRPRPVLPSPLPRCR